MNTQTHLSPADAAELESYRQRQRQLDREVRGFFAELAARYGNPGEDLSVGPDNALIRTSPKPEPKGRKRPAKEK
jgi:hypothetical protein